MTTEIEAESLLSVLMKASQTAATYSAWLSSVPVGQTPKEVVWSRNKACLYHYLPQAELRHPVPILLIYSLLNRAYILDLRPGASLIEFLVQQGYNVYLLDWGVPGPEDANLTLSDYALAYLPRAIKHTLRHCQAPTLTLLGYCLGATLTLCYLAVHQATPVQNLVMLAAPVDFQEAGLLQSWLATPDFDLDLLVATYGLIPGEILDFGMRLLQPYRNFIGTYADLWLKQHDSQAVTAWLSMQRWVNEVVPVAGAAFRQCVQDLYRENKLIRGELCLAGQMVKLAQIKAATLNIIAGRDHLVLPSQSQPLIAAIGSQDKQTLVLPGGHVGVVVGCTANQELWPKLDGWLAVRSI